MLFGQSLALIAAPTKIKSSSLRTFLTSIVKTHITFETYTLADTFRTIESQHPALLVFDVDLAGEECGDYGECLRKIHEAAPKMHLIVLVNSIEQRDQALEIGANYAMIKSF